MRRRDRPEDQPLGLWAALIVLALSMHGVAALMLEGVMASVWGSAGLPRTERLTQVELLDGDPVEPERDAPDKAPEQQLVKNDRVVDETRPERSDLVSDRDNTTRRQTTAPIRRPLPGADRPATGEGDRGAPRQAEQRPGPARDGPSREADGQAGERDGAAKDRLAERADGSLEAAAGAGARSPAEYARSRDALRRSVGSAGSFEKVPRAEQGAENLLETVRVKYASFFNRVRDAVADNWHADSVHARHDPTGERYGRRDRSTLLQIALSPDGSLVRSKVLRSSGLDHLDAEAVRAVRAAAPFANPPAQLVDPETGTIDFTFEFVLMMDGTTRVFRSRR